MIVVLLQDKVSKRSVCPGKHGGAASALVGMWTNKELNINSGGHGSPESSPAAAAPPPPPVLWSPQSTQHHEPCRDLLPAADGCIRSRPDRYQNRSGNPSLVPTRRIPSRLLEALLFSRPGWRGAAKQEALLLPAGILTAHICFCSFHHFLLGILQLVATVFLTVVVTVAASCEPKAAASLGWLLSAMFGC